MYIRIYISSASSAHISQGREQIDISTEEAENASFYLSEAM